MTFPENLKYTKEHEWAKTENGLTIIGITDHAQSSLGDIVFLDLPAIGRALKKGETFGVVESIKAVSDLYSPISGTVKEINSTPVAEPGKLNTHPYDCWLIKIEASDSIQNLMSAKDYQNYVSTLS